MNPSIEYKWSIIGALITSLSIFPQRKMALLISPTDLNKKKITFKSNEDPNKKEMQF